MALPSTKDFDMRLGRILLLLCSLFGGKPLLAQDVDSMMTVYASAMPREKIHVHFDRPQYNRGDTVWYKVYLLAEGMPSPLSKNMYVEWYDSAGTLLHQSVAPLFQSTAHGSYALPVNYKGPYVQVRAFTRWMLNDDTAFLYRRNLPLNNGDPVLSGKPTITKTQVELFPEGGSLVVGTKARVAFKATAPSGLPVKIRGVVVNQKGEVMDSIKTLHDGMGSFFLWVQPGEDYRIDWVDNQQQKGSTPLPTALADGVVMQIRTTNDKAIVQVERPQQSSEDNKSLTLLVHQEQHQLFKAAIKLGERLQQRANIPIDELPSGIVQFTLFDAQWRPLAERIILVNNHNHEFNAKLNPIVVNLDKRGKNALEIMVSDTAAANLSVAVTDASVPLAYPYSIYSDFLLSNDIKGYVHNPSYYFTSDADSITARLELVLLTNGWRRFNWEKMRQGVGPVVKYAPEQAYMSLKGKVFGAKPAPGAPLQLNFFLVSKDSSKQFFVSPIDRDGQFEEPGIFFYDTVKVYYGFNGNTKMAAGAQVKLDNGLMKKEPGFKLLPGALPPISGSMDSLARARLNYFLKEQDRLRKLMAEATLSEVVVKAKAKSPLQVLDERYASGLFAGSDAFAFDLVNDNKIAAFDILTFLQGRVPGLQISGNGPSARLSWRGATPELFLNEMRSDVSMVSTIPIPDIAYVKVFRPPFFGAAGGGAGGAIAIYTRNGKEARTGVGGASKGLDNTLLAGYTRFREFYSPVYENTGPVFEQDTRNTLYWNPYVITNKSAPRVKLEFYNNDVSKKLQVVVEGINADGKMTRVVKVLE